MQRRPEAILALEDGALFRGRAFGARGEHCGEVVFTTGMTGYQEVLTDPSYHGQIVIMTCPHIGNYGVNDDDAESARPWVSGFIVREASPVVSNWRATGDLESYLIAHNIVALTEIDTRALVRHIRTRGAMRGIISSDDLDSESLIHKSRASRAMSGADLAREVTCTQVYEWNYGVIASEAKQSPTSELEIASSHKPLLAMTRAFHIVAYDFGIKHNILRMFAERGCRVTIVPATTRAEDVLALKPDGIFLSNGPGDPAAVTYAIEATKKLLGRVPIFGICLGHQILGLALGAKTYKLKFGHRGGNQPVKHLPSGKVEITTHNHGFAVDANSLPNAVEITHVNLNDNCVEGLRHKNLPAFSVQYHPEAAPGPHDARYLFDEFARMMKESK
ncbi:MAG: glutamine-hydrolyzing carbamoyl-phosphate synthase small subunit [Chloroflexi bacterium]|nr:glutamine-hydrolyzing carbamoyl-phosphate synthase small subunit [Chloroflexota bacterium]